VKKLFLVMLSVVLIDAGLSTTSNAQQKTAASKQPAGQQLIIAYIDNKFMLGNAAVFKDVNAQVQKFRAAVQSDVRSEEEALRKATEDLKRKRQVLSADAFDAERERYQDRVAALQARVDRIQKEFARSEQKILGKVRGVVNEIIKDVSKELNLILILRRRDMIFAHPSLDITKLIIARLDKKMPKLKVPDPRNSRTLGK
jgi:Skp family chaperone for outer membrane proteins